MKDNIQAFYVLFVDHPKQSDQYFLGLTKVECKILYDSLKSQYISYENEELHKILRAISEFAEMI